MSKLFVCCLAVSAFSFGMMAAGRYWQTHPLVIHDLAPCVELQRPPAVTPLSVTVLDDGGARLKVTTTVVKEK